MRAFNLVFVLCVLAFSVSCSSDDDLLLLVDDGQSLTNEEVTKKANENKYSLIPVTDLFGSDVPELVSKLKENRIISLGAFIHPYYIEPPVTELNISALSDNGWRLYWDEHYAELYALNVHGFAYVPDYYEGYRMQYVGLCNNYYSLSGRFSSLFLL